MGRRLDALFGRTSRQTSKLKSLLGLTVSRLAVLRNQRDVRCAHARRDVAQLLRLDAHQERALLRAEQVIKEQNMLDAFVIIQGYCYLLTERATLLEPLKECPDELREAISGIIFAVSRCGDLPELQKVRYMFSSKFGKEFTTAAVELRNNCGVNPKLIQKLSTRQPSLEIRVKVTKEIAAENGIALDLEDPLPEFAAEVDPKLGQSKGYQSHPAPNPASDFSELGREDRFSANTTIEYKDAASAAQDAFESAAYAAAAARVAVKLSRSESKGDDQSRPGSGRRIEHRNYISESESEEEPISDNPTEKSSSASAETRPAVIYGRGINETPDEVLPIKHEASYLHPPYRKGNPVRHGDDFRSSLNRSRDGDDHVSYYPEGRARAESIQRPVSMRTRRGFQ